MNKAIRILIVFLFSLNLTTAGQCLSGSYTIGGTAPSYASPTEAVNALATKGICGPVTFNLRPGTYSQPQLVIPAISGASHVNKITFTSENGQNASVTLTSTDTATILLNGADHITFSKLTITNAFANKAYGIILTNNADNNQVRNCDFINPNFTPQYLSNYIYSTAETCDSLIVQHSTFKKNSHAVYLVGVTDGFNGCVIRNNNFIDQDLRSIASAKANLEIVADTFSINQLSAYCISIAATTQKTTVSNNYFNIENGSAVLFNDCKFSTPALISNNFVEGQKMQATLYVNNSNNIKFYHNTSRNLYGDATIIKDGTVSGLDVKNNIIIQRADGVLYLANNFTGISSDANLLFTNFYAADVNDPSKKITNLSIFNMATGLDAHSDRNIPGFIDTINLHILSFKGSNPYCIAYPETAKDIDGDPRSATHPFYGADEFVYTPNTNETGIVSFSLSNEFQCGGSKTISLKIRNYGSANLTKATIKWKLNGVGQPDVNWTGNLGMDTATVVLSTAYNFDVKQSYNFTAFISTVNNVLDDYRGNDTIYPFGFQFNMNGAYTVGGSTPNYATLTDAVNDLKKYGICGPITFLIRPGTYSDTISFTGPIYGSSATNTITFQSSTGNTDDVILDGTAKGSCVSIFNTSYILFKNLNFKNTSTNLYNVHVKQYSQSTGLTFSHCTFNSVDDNAFLNGDEYFDVFDHCSFYSQNRPNINLSGRQKFATISNCTFHSPKYYALYCGASEVVKITNNVFKNCAAILTSNYTHLLYFEHNTADSVGYANMTPVYISYPWELNFNYNNFLTGTAKSNFGNAILYIAYCKTASGKNYVMNNVLNQPPTDVNATALFVNESERILFCHNTIRMASSDSSAAAIYTYLATNNTFKNNIIANQGTGYCFLMGPGTANNILDNNGYFTKGKYLGNTNSIKIPDLESWKQQTQNDQHSLFTDPYFVSALDLHPRNILLKGAGAALGNLVPVDLDSLIRDTLKPDPGAYLFYPVALDAGLSSVENAAQLCEGTTAVKVKLKNGGSSTLNTITINWVVNNVAQPVFNASNLSLTTGKDTLLTLGNITYQQGVNYNMLIWGKNPNGSTDLLSGNDTIALTNLKTGLKGTYTIGGNSPNYANLQTAVTDLNARGICGSVVFNIRDGIYKGQLNLNTIAGVTSNQTITFRSENNNVSLVTIAVDTTFGVDYLLRLKKTSNIAFSNLTFQSVSSATTLVKVEEECSSLTFSNCIFKRESSYFGNCFNATKGIQALTLESNTFDGSLTPVLISSNSPIESKDVHILKNKFQNYWSTGLDFASARNSKIEGNIFLATPALPAYAGISFRAQQGSFVVDKNQINGNQNGILLSLCMGDALAKGRIANNMINISANYALFFSSIEHADIAHNTFNNSNSSNTSTSGDDNGYNKNILNVNNIYSHLGQGYAYRKGTYPDSAVVFNNNDYYTKGSKFVNWSNTDIATLADLKVASAQNAKSISADPTYLSATNLHISDTNAQLNSAGSAITVITVDIDGELRSSPPDIGADEYVYNIPTEITTPAIVNNELIAFPNPYSLSTSIHYSLKESSFVTLQVYNTVGVLIYTVLQEKQNSGDHTVEFNSQEIGLKNGLYFLKLSDGTYSTVLRVVQTN